jgi:hypothetical protein
VAPPVWAEHHRAGDDELAGEDEDCSSSFFFEIVERGERDRFRERIKGKK